MMPIPEPLITTSPARLNGTPVFAGSLMDYLEAGDSLDEFLVDFLPRVFGAGHG